MFKVLMIIMVFHSSIGHTNSEGRSKSISFLPFNSVAECEKVKPFIADQIEKEVKRCWSADNKGMFKRSGGCSFDYEYKLECRSVK